MKIGSQFFAILAVGALSTQVASAGHHGHRASTGAAASHSGTDAQSLAKSPLAGSRQGPGPALQGDIAEDGSGLTNTHKRNTDEAPAKTDTAPKTTPAATHGLQRAATPAPGADGKQGNAGVPIDTRITVNQGRETIKVKDRRFNKNKTAAAPGIGLKHEPVRNLHQGSLVGTEAGPHRNAIGAVVEHDKTVANRNGTVGGVAAPSTNVALQRAGAMLREPDNKIVSGNTSVKTQSPSTTELGNHASPAAAALRVVSSNGLSISGTGIIRPGLGVVALGGPAKNGASGLGGSSFRPRHP
jgi:hypothetical protein